MKIQAMKRVTWMLVIAMLLCAISTLSVFATEIETEAGTEEAPEIVAGTTITTEGTYNLFNSGRTGEGDAYSEYSYPFNLEPDTFDNNGYDIYVECIGAQKCWTSQLGESFYVKNAITEKVQVSINAFDVDESAGEYDAIYLVDEDTGDSVQVGKLSGMDWEWNNTTFDIDPVLFVQGHTYHYQIVSEESGWVVWVRTVAMSVAGTDFDIEDVETEEGETLPVVIQPVTNISASVGISLTGEVSVDVILYAEETTTFNVELKATHVATNNQVGSYNGTVTASPEGTNNTLTFSLERGAPEGTYRLDAYIKDVSGNIVKSVATVAGYVSFAVAYNANGGSQNLPMDYTAYYEGDTVVILYDYIPSKAGYNFLGWSTDSNATEPEFVAGTAVTLSIGVSDVTLYAVWEEIPPETEPATDPATESALDTEPATETENDSDAGDIFEGCFGTIGASSLVLLLASGVALLRRKKD